MKKTRYIPYGYTVRNGLTVVECNEADVVKEIFKRYIDGESLKDIADSLSAHQIPYTEKTAEWDKARIARIIDNAKYVGEQDYEPIIEEDIFKMAVDAKTARQRNKWQNTHTGIDEIRNRVRCAKCGAMMIRKTCQKCRIPEAWECTNDECGLHIRIPDAILLEKINITLNRIIENTALLIPQTAAKQNTDSANTQQLRVLLAQELSREQPSEETILSLISSIASERYEQSDADNNITVQLARKRLGLYTPQDDFQASAFNEIISTIILDEYGQITLYTKTEVQITEE